MRRANGKSTILNLYIYQTLNFEVYTIKDNRIELQRLSTIRKVIIIIYAFHERQTNILILFLPLKTNLSTLHTTIKLIYTLKILCI